jgi:hypothetical protein
MSKQQMPVMKCFISFNTERPEELCGGDHASNRKAENVRLREFYSVGGVEKQTARLEDPGGP